MRLRPFGCFSWKSWWSRKSHFFYQLHCDLLHKSVLRVPVVPVPPHKITVQHGTYTTNPRSVRHQGPVPCRVVLCEPWSGSPFTSSAFFAWGSSFVLRRTETSALETFHIVPCHIVHLPLQPLLLEAIDDPWSIPTSCQLNLLQELYCRGSKRFVLDEWATW